MESERHIPRLAGKDEQNGRQLKSYLAVGKKRHESQHDSWQKGQNGDALQNVQERHHHPLGHLAGNGNACIDQAEQQREEIGCRHTEGGQPSIEW